MLHLFHVIASERVVQVFEGSLLELVGILELSNPFSFLLLKPRDLLLNLNPFFIFFVNLSYQIQSLLLTLELLLLLA